MNRKLFWILLLCIEASVVLAVFSECCNADDVQLLDAIMKVESKGDINCKDGDNGKAIGPYQIWKSYWEDAIEYDHSIGGTYQDCRKKDYSEKIIRSYWKRYAPINATDEQLARIHNGGPKGYKKKCTIKYWKKVEKCLGRI